MDDEKPGITHTWILQCRCGYTVDGLNFHEALRFRDQHDSDEGHEVTLTGRVLGDVTIKPMGSEHGDYGLGWDAALDAVRESLGGDLAPGRCLTVDDDYDPDENDIADEQPCVTCEEPTGNPDWFCDSCSAEMEV